MLYYVMWCYIMLLCHVVTCYIMSCYVMLCYVVLYFVMHSVISALLQRIISHSAFSPLLHSHIHWCRACVGVSAPQSFALDLLHDLLQERRQLFRWRNQANNRISFSCSIITSWSDILEIKSLMKLMEIFDLDDKEWIIELSNEMMISDRNYDRRLYCCQGEKQKRERN